jgi:hypothetical protein
MTNPTSNFNWQMPTATDLVTDLPADFEVFGQAVDTSLADLKGGTTGQILAKATNADMDFVWTAANPGDITGVTAGTGISGGGTSGTVTVTNDMATTITTNGDLIYGTGSGTYTRRGIGSTGQVLTVSGGVPTWATPGGAPNWSLLNTGGTSLSGVATVTVSGISNASQVLVIHENAASGTANSTVSLRINADTGTNYDRRVQVNTQPGTSYATSISSATAQTNDDQVFLGQQSNSTGANAVINGYVLISGASTSGVKPVFMVSGGANDGTTNGFQATRIGTAIYDSSSAVSSITFRTTNASNFTGGTIYVYTTA